MDDISKTITIKDILTDSQLFVVPRHVFNVEKFQMHELMTRFDWINESSFKYVNEEGVECKYEFEKEFK